METIKEFRNCPKKIIKAINSNHYYDDPNGIEHVIEYNGHVEIAKLLNGKYHLIIERSDYTGKLEDLEEILWDWLKHELGLNADEMEDDLHQRARDLMLKLDKKYKRKSKLSLDEYLLEFTFLESESDNINYLLDQFNEL